MSERKLRHQFYLDTRLSEKLEALSSRPGASKTSILTAALTNWIEQRGASEVEVRFAARLDLQQRVQQRLERKTDALIELVGVFVQHQMALVAHHPPFDPETAQLGKERFGSLLDLVERRISNDGIVARLACCRFGGHRDRVFPPIGGPQCKEGSSAASSSLRR